MQRFDERSSRTKMRLAASSRGLTAACSGATPQAVHRRGEPSPESREPCGTRLAQAWIFPSRCDLRSQARCPPEPEATRREECRAHQCLRTVRAPRGRHERRALQWLGRRRPRPWRGRFHRGDRTPRDLVARWRPRTRARPWATPNDPARTRRRRSLRLRFPWRSAVARRTKKTR